MTEHARRAIAEGRQIIIFPEGTRRPPFAPPEYRHGVARLYAELGVPCLPIALNSGLFWPRHALVHRRGTILAECLPPIPPGLPPEVFAARLKEAIESATERAPGRGAGGESGASRAPRKAKRHPPQYSVGYIISSPHMS